MVKSTLLLFSFKAEKLMALFFFNTKKLAEKNLLKTFKQKYIFFHDTMIKNYLLYQKWLDGVNETYSRFIQKSSIFWGFFKL